MASYHSFLVTWLVFVIAITASPLFEGRSYSNIGGLSSKYDYIVVGGGTSGLVVANRLSEDSGTSVLVIEAGQFDQGEDFITVPGLAGGGIGTKYDWNVTYLPTTYVANRTITRAIGKVVGGGSKLNLMAYVRGSEADYDRFATLGSRGWNWAALFPYFKKTEIFAPPHEDVATEFGITYDPDAHGYHGYINSTFSPWFWPTTKNLVDAAKELNLPIRGDGTGGNGIGAYYVNHNQNHFNFTRCAAREGYYNNFASRQNLHLITGHQVTRLVATTSSHGVRVTGVEFQETSGGNKTTVSVVKEAILAAGSIFTPQILQVSGIGNPDHLRRINVTPVVELQGVGHNLQDHPRLPIPGTVASPLVITNLTTNATFAAEALAEFKINHTGPYSTTITNFAFFLNLGLFSNSTTEIQAEAIAEEASFSTYLPSNTPPDVLKGYQEQYKLLNEQLNATNSAVAEILWRDGTFSIGPMHPYSRGLVEAVSSNTFDKPICYPGFLSNPIDMKIYIEAFKFTRVISNTKAISVLNPQEIAPGPSVVTDEQIEAYIRNNAVSFDHPVGSCKMGPRDKGGVVDAELRVYGTENLRIVDASVLPLLPAAHTMTTVYAVAERVSVP
ncbi:putative oxidoreductase [Xylariales sp. PMI_506]|nr:putative oxidoreductase [Xylariales sp. PMI_506]